MRLAQRSKYAVLTFFLIGAGLLTRWPVLGQQHIALKYLGSIIWGGMVYGVVAILAPRQSPPRIAFAAGLIATGVEFSQLLHAEALDAFRRTTIGVLFIGRFFSWWDIVSYLGGIAAISTFDKLVIRAEPRGKTKPPTCETGGRLL